MSFREIYQTFRENGALLDQLVEVVVAGVRVNKLVLGLEATGVIADGVAMTERQGAQEDY